MTPSIIRKYYLRSDLAVAVRTSIDFLSSLSRGSFSQHGEDQFILQYFGQRRHGIYLDIGANHPHRLSNTYLLYRRGWRGITVEPIRRLVDAHRKLRPADTQVHAGIGAGEGGARFYELNPHVLSTFDKEVADATIRNGVSELRAAYDVPILPVSSIVSTYAPGPIDVMSVDVEGLELSVLNSVDWESCAPQLILVELQTAAGRNPAANEIREFLKSRGYRFVISLGVNEVFERASSSIISQGVAT